MCAFHSSRRRRRRCWCQSVSLSHQKIQISREFVIIFLKVFYSPLVPHQKLRLLLLPTEPIKPSVWGVCVICIRQGRENENLFLLLLLLKKGEFFRSRMIFLSWRRYLPPAAWPRTHRVRVFVCGVASAKCRAPRPSDPSVRPHTPRMVEANQRGKEGRKKKIVCESLSLMIHHRHQQIKAIKFCALDWIQQQCGFAVRFRIPDCRVNCLQTSSDVIGNV